MADEIRFAPTIHERPSVPKRERLFAPMYCLCGLMQDEGGHSVHSEHWITRRTFLRSPSLQPDRLSGHSHLLTWVFHSGNRNWESTV